MKAAQRIVGIAPAVAGDVLVLEEELAKKLGRAAWLVWQILAAKRDKTGLSRTYGSALMNARGFQTVARSTMHKAIRRLEKAGLVERIGYKMLPTKTAVGVKMLPVHARCVRGARALHLVGSEARMLVPAITAAWMATAAHWGGTRSNAGRTADRERCLRSKANQEESVDLGIKRSPIMVITTKGNKHTRKELRSPSESESCPASAGDSSSLVRDTETELGTISGGNGQRVAVIMGNPVEGLPPFPGISLVPAASIPNPPLLRADMTAHEFVSELVKWYRGALEAVYDVRMPRRKSAVKKKDRQVLLVAAGHLVAHDIPPSVWCAFRIDRYKNAKLAPGAKRPSMPPLAYVFSEKALTENRWQFRAVWGDALIGGRLIYGARFYALYTRYRQMVAAVNGGMKKSQARSLFFPGELYDEMVDAAKVEAVETQNKITMQIERGVYSWPL